MAPKDRFRLTREVTAPLLPIFIVHAPHWKKETASLLEFSLCLSGACLGKIIIFGIELNGSKEDAFSYLESVTRGNASHARLSLRRHDGC